MTNGGLGWPLVIGHWSFNLGDLNMGRQNRRQLLQTSALAGVGFWAAGGFTPSEARAANEKLNVAFIGVGGMGGGNLGGVAGTGENVVALCDIDENTLGKAAEKHAKAEKFADYREMYDKVKNIDAVVVSTPDHSHAPAAVRALRAGRHVYCEKPLTWAVHEARLMKQLAAEKKVATQMGNRGTSEGGFRTGVETLRSGVLGDVKEIHVWTNRPIWPQGMERPKTEPVPKGVHWDLWIGPAKFREYHSSLHPFKWRGFVDFGTGAMGDMACHTCNLAYMGLELTAPTSVECVSSPFNGDTHPSWATMTFLFPARGSKPPVTMTWYEGKRGKDDQNLPTKEAVRGIKLAQGKSGMLIVGDKGMVFSPDDYGSKQDWMTLDGKKMEVKTPEPTLPRSPGHYKEWVNACKGGKPCLSNFDYAASLTEAVLLGVVALRAGKKIEYDGASGKITNIASANQFLTREYRKGFEV
jgi:predicted dehydrogenase